MNRSDSKKKNLAFFSLNKTDKAKVVVVTTTIANFNENSKEDVPCSIVNGFHCSNDLMTKMKSMAFNHNSVVVAEVENLTVNSSIKIKVGPWKNYQLLWVLLNCLLVLN